MRRKQEFDCVGAVRPKLTRGFHVDEEPGVGHRQGSQLAADPLCQFGGRFGAKLGQSRGFVLEAGLKLRQFCFECFDPVAVIAQVSQACPAGFGPFQDLIDRRSVLAHQRGQFRPPGFDFGQASGTL